MNGLLENWLLLTVYSYWKYSYWNVYLRNYLLSKYFLQTVMFHTWTRLHACCGIRFAFWNHLKQLQKVFITPFPHRTGLSRWPVPQQRGWCWLLRRARRLLTRKGWSFSFFGRDTRVRRCAEEVGLSSRCSIGRCGCFLLGRSFFGQRGWLCVLNGRCRRLRVPWAMGLAEIVVGW